MPDPMQHDGMYLVGQDLAAGTYTISADGVPGTGHDKGSFAVVHSADPAERREELLSHLTTIGAGETALVTVSDGEYLDMRYCHISPADES